MSSILDENVEVKTFVKIQPVKVPMLQSELLKSRRAIVTGGSGGIGFGIAQAFVNSGASVVLIGTNEKKLIDSCEKLGIENSKFDVMNLMDFSS